MSISSFSSLKKGWLRHLMEIDQDKENPSEISSKKRKLEDERLDLPSPKHNKWEQSSVWKQDDPFPEDREAKPINSAKDSNSFVGEPNSAISLYPQADEFELEFPKAYAYDQPSTSSYSCSGNSLKDTLGSSNREKKVIAMNDRIQDTRNVVLQFESGPQNSELQLSGFGRYADSICSAHRDDEVEKCEAVGSNDMIISGNGSNANFYVLSSGRWSIRQNTGLGLRNRKPTIDQEFEKYFSMLML